MNKKLIGLIVSMMLTSSAWAQVTVTQPWVRATVPQQKVSGAFMQLQSAQDTRLVEVRSAAAGTVEIHQMEMVGQTMKMRLVPGVDLPAGKPVALGPGGYHVMLMDLKHQLKEGDVVPVTLVFEGKHAKRETITLKVPVKPLAHSTAKDGAHMEHMKHMQH